MTVNAFLKPRESDRQRNLQRFIGIPPDDPRRMVNEVVDGGRRITQVELDTAVERLTQEGTHWRVVQDFVSLASTGLIKEK